MGDVVTTATPAAALFTTHHHKAEEREVCLTSLPDGVVGRYCYALFGMEMRDLYPYPDNTLIVVHHIAVMVTLLPPPHQRHNLSQTT